MAKKKKSPPPSAATAAGDAGGGGAFPWSTTTLTPATTLSIALFAVLLRLLTGLGPYSGAATPSKYGDYEAQRHWMELTLHLPARDWYRPTPANDLAYWGLDYPPLSAYQSLTHALLLNASAPDAVALHRSRGFESAFSKLLMRWTVLLSDIIIFFPAAIAAVAVLGGGPWELAVVLVSPGLILIDHGHFQYNCISLGLVLGAVAAVVGGRELVGAVLFSLAINHKQMSMYFAPAFFSHLLGKCLKRQNPIFEVMKLGFVVLGTFAIVWWPYLYSLEAVVEVLSRLAPFERGIYEDYVANFWCSTSVLIKWKRLFTVQSLRLLSLVSTITASLPSFIQQIKAPSNHGFLYALLSSSFSFYLFSYQVHEKSILMPLLPASLLAQQEPLLFGWLTYFALLSMYPLLCRDGLLLQYTALLALSGLIVYSRSGSRSMGGNSSLKKKIVPTVPILLSIALHFIYLTRQPPEKYPFLFDALIVILCFSQFVLLTFYTNIKQWMLLDYPVPTRVAKKDL